MNCPNEIRLKGAPVSEGIGIGRAYFLTVEESEEIPEFPITLSEVDREIARYRKALFSSKEDLRKLQENLTEEGSNEAVSLIDAHIHMLEDPLITTQMEQKIRCMLKNTEFVFRGVIKDFEQRFTQRSDSFFQQRLVDVTDLSNRILDHLRHTQTQTKKDIPQGSVVFAKELAPFHAAAAHGTKVSAFVSMVGGGNSHAALIARSKGIPFVANIDVKVIEALGDISVIVDGVKGEVILNPTSETLAKYRQMQNQMITRYQRLDIEESLKVETIDGFQVRLFANIGHPKELEGFPSFASGIGLFRTEYLFLQKKQNVFPSEEEQFEAYFYMMQKMQERPIVFRLFDIGGDKYADFSEHLQKEPNPMLGCRGIRFLLRNRSIFITQVRALLRLCQFGPVQLLIPLVSDIGELRSSKKIINEIRAALIEEGVPIKFPITIGCMIEVPSSVMICDAIASECDFMSIGTNDLIQYTLGVDRSNPAMNDLFYPIHPSVVRMIKMVASVAQNQDKPLMICGEIASNPLFIALLLGLGVKEFSCSLRYIPVIRRAIRQCTLFDAFQLAEQVLHCKDPEQISQLLQSAHRHLEAF